MTVPSTTPTSDADGARDPVAAGEPALAESTVRLMAEFGPRAEESRISRIVRGCHRDLQGSPVAALPELIERLARQRLLQAEE